MKKNIAKLFSMIMVFGFACCFMTTGVVAAAPNEITVKRAEILSPLVDNAKYGFTIFNTTDGKVIFCADVDKKALLTGQTAKLSGDADDGILYILRNGYPNKEITGNDEIDKYITQAAVWWYLGENKLSDEFKNATKATDIYELVPKYIKPMVTAARSYKDTQAIPSMKVTADGTVFSISTDGKYYESPLLGAALTGAQTYNVTVTGGTGGTLITDFNNNVKSTFKATEKVKIRVPVKELTGTANIEVKFTASGNIQKAKYYATNDNSFQRVVGLYNDELNLMQTINLSVTGGTSEEVINVPDTSANIIIITVVLGVLAIIGGLGVIFYHSKHPKKTIK